ncbi:MAG: hypothetical protein DKM24_03470 [Candidatus Melainabacteria bacterium]|nr:MAG: hypothetical protein DKM24_03470 [Candidatus Melainabacteria bacterium]
MTNEALFDPGFTKSLIPLSLDTKYFYDELNMIKNFNIKKSEFRIALPKLAQLTERHIGFYVGCMLWGAYLKTLGSEKIIGNPFLGKEYEEEPALSEINFIFDFVKKLDKDSKYYIGKPYTFDPQKLEILELYKEFIKKNESFVNTDTVDKIVLVGKLETMSKEEILEIKKKIQDVIHTGKLEELLEFCDKI